MMRRSGWIAGLLGALALFAAACMPPDPGPTNQVPTAVIVATPTSGSVPLTVSFDGSGTFVAPIGVDLAGSTAVMITLEESGGAINEPGPQVVFGEL